MSTLQSGHTPSIATLRSTAWHALHVQFDHSEYWSDRYARDAAPFEWYRGYEDLAPVLNRTVAKTARVLHAGVGTSMLHESMADDGYRHIENVDYSAEAIACVQRRWQERCATWAVAGWRRRLSACARGSCRGRPKRSVRNTAAATARNRRALVQSTTCTNSCIFAAVMCILISTS